MKKSEFRKLIREEIRSVLKEALDPNTTYRVDIGTSRWSNGAPYSYSGEFDPGKVKKVAGEPLMVAKAVLKMAKDDRKGEYIMAFELDQDTYFIIIGDEDVTIVGKPKSKKYGQFWSLIDSDPDAASDMLDDMDVAAAGAKKI